MALSPPVSTSVGDGIAHVTISNPPVNAISQAVREGLLKAISQVNKDLPSRASDIDVVMISDYGFPRHKGGPMFSV